MPLWRGNLKRIVRQIAFRNAAIVDYDLAGRALQFNSRRGCAFGTHFNSIGDLAVFRHNGEWNLRARIAEVFQSYGDELYILIRLPWMRRLHAEIRQAAILIHPIVEEPS